MNQGVLCIKNIEKIPLLHNSFTEHLQDFYCLPLIKKNQKNTTAKKIVLNCSNNSIIVSVDQIKRCKTLKNMLKDCRAPISIDLPLDGQAIDILLKGMQEISICDQLTNQEIKATFHAADYLEAPVKLRQKLAALYEKKILQPWEKESLTHDEKEAIHKIRIKLVGQERSVNTLLLESKMIYFQTIDGIDRIDLSNQMLESLDGIERLQFPRDSVKFVSLENNKLKKLDEAIIIKNFPNIREINASRNNIKESISVSCQDLRHTLTINLGYNRIGREDIAEYIMDNGRLLGPWIRRTSLCRSNYDDVD